MRIAYIVEHCHKKGGHERYVAQLAEKMSEKHEVHIFANSFSDVEAEVFYHHVPMFSKPTLLMLGSFIINAGILVAKHGPFDIIHSQGANAIVQNVVTNHTSQKARIIAMSEFAFLERGWLGRIHDILLEKMIVANEERIYGLDSRCQVIAVSNGVKREMLKFYKLPAQNITVVVNGVDLESFSPLNRKTMRADWRIKNGFSAEDFIILFVGGDWERKGLEIIIGALALIPQDFVKLAVVGNWHREAEYRKMVKSKGLDKRVCFCGATTQSETAYAGADLFVLASLYEACPFSVLEALASGLPIVMTAVNGSDEFVHSGENGFLIPRDRRVLSQVVNRFITERNLLVDMGSASRRIAQNYSWSRCIEETERVYLKVLNSQGAPI